MGDPHAYITPDVIADFTTIHLDDDGTDRVRVSGIKGKPPTDKLKVSIAYRAGFKAVGTLVYAWPDALDKAKLADDDSPRAARPARTQVRSHSGRIRRSERDARASRRRSAATRLRFSSDSEFAGRIARRWNDSRERSHHSCSMVRRASPDSRADGPRSKRSSRTGRRSSTNRL